MRDRHVESPLAWWREHVTPFGASRLATNTIATPDRTRWTMHEHRERELLWGITGEVTAAAAGSTLACTWFEPDGCSIDWPAPALVAVDPLLTGVLEHLDDLDLSAERRRTAEAFAAG